MKTKALLPASALALLALAAISSAQVVTFRGKVEHVPGTANEFAVACTGTYLMSTDVDLKLYLDQDVRIEGFWNGSRERPCVFVYSATPVARSFEMGGNRRTGGSMWFAAFGSPGDFALLAASFGSTFAPFDGRGVRFLDAASMEILGVGTFCDAGTFRISMPIPSDPALVGMEVVGQGMSFDRMGPHFLTNPACTSLR